MPNLIISLKIKISVAAITIDCWFQSKTTNNSSVDLIFFHHFTGMEMVTVSVFSDIQVIPKSLILSDNNLAICLFNTFINIKRGYYSST